MQFLAVVFVLALLAAVLWWLQRRGALVRTGAGERRMECVERLRLTPSHVLHLVRVGNRRLVVATHGTGCTVISENEEIASEGWERPVR